MKFKKPDLEQILVLIQAEHTPKDGESVLIGLLHESISLGLKRRLTKLHDLLVPLYVEYVKDKSKIEQEAKTDEERVKELADLDAEELEVEFEPVRLDMIEAIETKYNYNWDMIVKIAK